MSRAIFVLVDGWRSSAPGADAVLPGPCVDAAQSESGDGAYRAEYDPARRLASPVSTVVLGLRERRPPTGSAVTTLGSIQVTDEVACTC